MSNINNMMPKRVIDGDRLRLRAPLTMGTIAALLLVTALLAQRTSREVSILQEEITDKWAYYGAKRLQVFMLETFRDLAGAISKGDPKAVQPDPHFEEKYTADIKRFEEDSQEIASEATQLEARSSELEIRGKFLYIAELLLAISVVASSLAMLTRLERFWYAALLLGLAGAANLTAAWR